MRILGPQTILYQVLGNFEPSGQPITSSMHHVMALKGALRVQGLGVYIGLRVWGLGPYQSSKLAVEAGQNLYICG